MTLQLKTSRMKKRLFENTWLFPSCILAIFGLIVIFGFSLRAVTLAWSYGLVDAEIPLTPINYEDAIIKTKPELTGGVINYTTPMILLTKEAFSSISFCGGHLGKVNE